MLEVRPIFCRQLPTWLAADWQRLLAQSHAPNFQLDFDVMLAWSQRVRGRWKLLILNVHDDQTIVGIVPLMYLDERRRGIVPFRRIRFLAHDATDFSGILAARSQVDPVVEAALSWLFSGELRWELLILDDLIGTNPAVDALRANLERIQVQLKIHEGRYYYVDLDRPWDQIWASTSKKFVRRNVNLARNRLSKAGTWKRIDNPDWDTETIVANAAVIHQTRQAALGRNSIFGDPDWRSFVTSSLQHHLNEKRVRTHWLELNGVTIAYLIGFVDQQNYYAWNMAFLPEYADYYPSRFLFAEVIKHCHEKGLKAFSFMRGESEYKAKWTPNYHTNVRFVVRRTDHLLGKFVHMVDRVR